MAIILEFLGFKETLPRLLLISNSQLKESYMKTLIALVCLGFAFIVSAPAFAGAQQEKMKGCNKEAKGMKGDERKAFMSSCLKG